MDFSSLKLTISGTSGTGKSTLARTIAEQWNLQLIDEGFDDEIRRYKGKPATEWAKDLMTVLKHKKEQEEKLGAFIADRCPLDLFSTWMSQRLHLKSEDKVSQHFLHQCLQASQHYDFIIFTPWNSIPFKATEPDRPRMQRNKNRFARLRGHTAMLGLAHMFIPKRKIIEIPASLNKTEDRLDFVARTISRRSTGKQ